MQSTIKGTTVVISHQERILNIADYVILMKDGKIVQHGNTRNAMYTHK